MKVATSMEISQKPAEPASGAATPAAPAEAPKHVTREPSPEASAYLHLLIVIHLLDKKQYQDVCPTNITYTGISSLTKKKKFH